MNATALGRVAPRDLALLREGLRIMAARAVGDEDTAEDIVQEALLRALKSVSLEVAQDPQRLGAYVGGIARNVIADVHRAARSARARTTPPPDLPPDTLTLMIRDQDHQAVQRALEQLPPSDREILEASVAEGVTPAKLAQRLGEPAERVRKRKSRALQRLRALLELPGGHDSSVQPSKRGPDVRMAGTGSGD